MAGDHLLPGQPREADAGLLTRRTEMGRRPPAAPKAPLGRYLVVRLTVVLRVVA